MVKDIYTAALIIIGDEILSGRTQDKNTAYIAENLNNGGVRLMETRTIPDDKQKIIDTVNVLRAEHDYVFTTGGIGPTHDDITAESIAAAFDVELVLDEGAYQELVRHYDGKVEITEARKKMAYVPKGAELVHNPVSGAPGIKMDNVYVFAGIPKIMQAMFDAVAPTLKGGKPVVSRTVTCDLPESVIAEGLGDIQSRYQMLSIGSYPKYSQGTFATALVLRGIDEDALAMATQEVMELVRSCGDDKPVLS